MSYWRRTKTEHTGHKGSTRKSGFWGTRHEAKQTAKRKRRRLDKAAASEDWA